MRWRGFIEYATAKWNGFWFGSPDTRSLGLFRICLGCLILAMYIALAANWSNYFGRDGVLSLTDAAAPEITVDSWSVFPWVPPSMLPSLWALGLVAALGFLVGWHTRVWTVVLFLLEWSMVHTNPHAINGEDLVLRMTLFYSMFTRLDDAMSLSAWLRRLRVREVGSPPPAWPVQLMKVNFLLIYAISLPNKLADDSAWLTGDAIYFSVVSNMWGRFPWPRLFYGSASDLLTYFTIAAEGLLPILVWIRATRIWSIAAVAALHLGIAVVLKNVAFFSLAMVCCLWLFVPGETIRLLSTKLQRMIEKLTVHVRTFHQPR